MNVIQVDEDWITKTAEVLRECQEERNLAANTVDEWKEIIREDLRNLDAVLQLAQPDVDTYNNTHREDEYFVPIQPFDEETYMRANIGIMNDKITSLEQRRRLIIQNSISRLGLSMHRDAILGVLTAANDMDQEVRSAVQVNDPYGGRDSIIQVYLNSVGKTEEDLEQLLDVPPELKDPISLVIMLKPVQTMDGQVYDFSSIKEHFDRQTQMTVPKWTSPLTNAQLGSPVVYKDYAQQAAILEWLKSKFGSEPGQERTSPRP